MSPLLVVLMLAIAPPAFAGFKSCLQGCNAKGSTVDCCELLGPDVAQACSDYKQDLSDIKASYLDCISTDHRDCRPTGDGGGCRILLEGCIRPCEEQRDRQVSKKRAKLAKAINASVDDGCKVRGGKAKRLAASVCTSTNHCDVPVATTTTSTSSLAATTTTPTASTPTTTAAATVTTSTPTATTTPTPIGNESDFDPCFKRCLNNIDSLKSCYERCGDNCERNKDALKACRQGCRNVRCAAITARCTIGSPDTDADYSACCDPDGEDGPVCKTRDDIGDEEICETTTTSTSTSTTTQTTVTTTSVTTTSLASTGV